MRTSLRVGTAALALTLAAAITHTGVSTRAAAQVPARPNILIILTDDMPARADYYDVLPATMRRFARRGTHWPNAVATTPLCCPSRASIFSGQYAHNHGVFGNPDAANLDVEHTVQAQLSGAGYRTAIAGKYLNRWTSNPPHFDRWASQLRGGYYNAMYNIDGTTTAVEDNSTTFVGIKAAEFLDDFEADDETPWFIQVSPIAPHAPATPAPEFEQAPVSGWIANPANSETDLSDKPPYVREQPARKGAVKWFRTKQLRSLMTLDEMVRDLFRKMTALDESQNTLAFFLSDNGYLLFEHRLRAKSAPYDASVQIPLFARWPGHIQPGQGAPGVVANIDLAPTIYSAAGIAPNYVVDGSSLLDDVPRRKHIFLELLPRSEPNARPQYRAIWSPRWEYIEYDDYVVEREYYGRSDPWQLHNSFAARSRDRGVPPANPAGLAALVDAYRDCAGETCP